MKKCSLVLFFSLVLLTTSFTSYAQDKLYYTISDATNSIYNVSRVNLDGSSAEIIVADDGSQSPSGIALDLTNSKIYFTDTGNKKIRKCDLDGGNQADVLTNVYANDLVGTNTNPPLPIEITSFFASISNGKVLLNWETATEINNYGFEIERSISNNITWERIGFVQGHGNSNSPRYYEFIDYDVLNTVLEYRLKQIDTDGLFEYFYVSAKVDASSITDVKENRLPLEFKLDQNYPNPFNPETTIRFELPKSSQVRLDIFETVGQLVETIVNEDLPAGKHYIDWNAASYASGIYIYKIRCGKFSQVRKMLLLK